MGHHTSDRKGHHVDMLEHGSRKGTHDRRESMRPASVSSSDLSDVSSLDRRSRKSSAPKVAAVVIASLAIVAVLVGVTVYLIDMEKEKQEIERAERIEEGIETEVEFAEAANAYIADEMEEVEDEVLQRIEAEKTRRERIKTLSQRRRFLENFQHRCCCIYDSTHARVMTYININVTGVYGSTPGGLKFQPHHDLKNIASSCTRPSAHLS